MNAQWCAVPGPRQGGRHGAEHSCSLSVSPLTPDHLTLEHPRGVHQTRHQARTIKTYWITEKPSNCAGFFSTGFFGNTEWKVLKSIKQTIKGKESSDSNRSNSLLIVGKNMFCFASEKGVLHFNGCNTKYKILSGCSCVRGLDPA